MVFLLFCMFQLQVYAQAWVYFTGSVTEIDSDNPVPDWPVLITVYDSLSIKQTFTNQYGIYFDSLFIEPGGFDLTTVTVYDCIDVAHTTDFFDLDSLNIADFTICTNQSDCYAIIGVAPDSANQYQVQFLNLSTGNYNFCYWDFGDGFTSEDCNPVHQYNAPGNYEVCLTIEDTLGLCFDTYCFVLTIDELNCEADFDWQPDEENPFEIHFTDLSEGEIVYWYWDFGDMNYSEEQSPVHQYVDPGQYLVTLTIVDSSAMCFDMVSKWVNITDSVICIADFSARLDTLNNIPNVYIFEDLSTGNPENWLWDFGDGQVSYEQNPIHTYEEEGEYEVCLTVSSNNDGNNCFDKICKTISTINYYNFGGQVFIGDYPLNIEEDDSSNMAIAYLYRRFNNQWQLMTSQEFWKFGYYWFVDKPEGDYIIRTDLLPGSSEFGKYAPVYHNNESSWNNADIFTLSNDEEFAVNVKLKRLSPFQPGISSISGRVEPGLDCEISMNLEGELIYLMNENYQMISYTYTDESGVFVFEGLGFGHYFVKAEITGKTSSYSSVLLDENNTSATDIMLEADCNSFVGVLESQTFTNFSINSIYPQPASEKLLIDLNAIQELVCQFNIIAIDGKTIWSKEIHLGSGKQIIEFNIPFLKSGLYLLKINDLNGKEKLTKKILIK